MAINWNWKDKMGTVEVPATNGKMLTLNIYHANCFCIMCNEWKNEEGIENYQVSSFIIDNDHLKNMIKDNAYADWKNWRLNGFFQDSWKIAKQLCKAKIEATIYWEDIKK